MLARLQQLITLGLLLGAIALALALTQLGHPYVALVGATTIVFGYAVFMAAEFVLLAFIQERDPTPAPTNKQLVRAWWGEITNSPRVFCWRQPFRSNVVPDHLPGSGQLRGVVFVHGFFCNRGFWNPWMTRLQSEGVPFIAVNLEPVFGSIAAYSSIIEGAVQRLEAATGRPPLIVAHSMGGLAVREWMRQTEDAYTRVHHIVTIGTPHHGTWMARWGRTVNGVEMRLKSPFVTSLSAAAAAHKHAMFTCFYGNCDNIVFPASTAKLEGADNRHVPAVAHVHMAFHPSVFSEAWRLLTGPARDAPTLPAFRFKDPL